MPRSKSISKTPVNKKNKKVNQRSVQPAKFSIRHYCHEPACPVDLMYLYVTRCGAATTIKTSFPVAKSLKERLSSAASMIATTVALNLPLLRGQQLGKPLTVQVPLRTGVDSSRHKHKPQQAGEWDLNVS